MDNQDLFFALVEKHCTTDLQKCRRYIDAKNEGVAVLSEEHMPYTQGVDECEHYPGVFVVKNGPETLQDLVKKGWIRDKMIGGFKPARGREDFLALLREEDERKEGRAYLFDGVNQTMTQVYKFVNDPSPVTRRATFDFLWWHFDLGVGRGNPYYSENLPLEELLPEDFLAADGSVKVSPAHIGTKTDLAMRFPRAYPELRTFQIKRAAYGDFGMGKVTHFDKDGLVEEVFLEGDEHGKGPFVDAELGLVGVHRLYRTESGEPFRDRAGWLIPYRVGLVDPACGYQAERYVLPFLLRVA